MRAGKKKKEKKSRFKNQPTRRYSTLKFWQDTPWMYCYRLVFLEVFFYISVYVLSHLSAFNMIDEGKPFDNMI